MGLDFTGIKDFEGVACYILHTGGEAELREFGELKRLLAERVNTQVALIDVHTADGENVRTFYAIEQDQLPAVLLVRNDDTLVKSCFGSELPDVDMLAYELQQQGV